MKHFKSIIVIAFIAIFNVSMAQCGISNLIWLDNDSIKFEISVGTKMGEHGLIGVKKYSIEVSTLNDTKLLALNNLTYDDWKCLLKDEKTDWATNLILYHITQKNALNYSHMDERTWKLSAKKSEIRKWRKYLRKQADKSGKVILSSG